MSDSFEEYLATVFLSALKKLQIGVSASSLVTVREYQSTVEALNQRLNLSSDHRYIWRCNDLPITPVPFTVIGATKQSKVNLAIWGLNPKMSPRVVDEKLDANQTTWVDYARFHIGISKIPGVLRFAMQSQYYKTLGSVIATIKDHEGLEADTIQKLHYSDHMKRLTNQKKAQTFWQAAKNFGVLEVEFVPFYSFKSKSLTDMNLKKLDDALDLRNYHQYLMDELLDKVLDWRTRNGCLNSDKQLRGWLQKIWVHGQNVSGICKL